MDFYDRPFGEPSRHHRGAYRPPSSRSRRRERASYHVEELGEDAGNETAGQPNTDQYVPVDVTVEAHDQSARASRTSSQASTPRVEEPDCDSGFDAPRRPHRHQHHNPSSHLARDFMHDPFGDMGFGLGFGFGDDDEDEDDFFFGSFGGINRHISRMQDTFSRAFEDIEAMSRQPNGGSAGYPGNTRGRVYCSSTCETILPNGMREVRHTSRDSMTGKQTSYHSRQIGDRRVVEHSHKDLRTGVEQRQRDMLNVNDDDIDEFDRRWMDLGLGGSTMKSLK